MKTSRAALEIARRKTVLATDEAAAIKTECRREDQALARAGRAREILKKNVAALGIDPHGERPRLLSINGVRFRT